jgi:hypothetical protein
LPFQFSAEFDLYNQAQAVKFFEERFYTNNRNFLTDMELQSVDQLRIEAEHEPVLALAAAQVLYMFSWFRSDGVLIRDNVVAAARLFDRSIAFGGCAMRPSFPEDGPYAHDGKTDDWIDNACDIRWMHASLLYNWLAESELDRERAVRYKGRALELMAGFRMAPKYKDLPGAENWVSPVQINFNSGIFPGELSQPIWPTDSLPMGKFLEDNHPVFKAELEAIMSDPRDLMSVLMKSDPSREHLGTPGGWDTLRIVRYHHWYDLFCEMAPRTCELIKSRPEISKCKFMNVNYVKLHPGAHLKPHFGNGPRLSAHLSVIAPEPLGAGMTVGDRRVLWVEGKAILFDDTYPHAVSHWGKTPRYVMLVWFCHPCDTLNEHGQKCPAKPSSTSLPQGSLRK